MILIADGGSTKVDWRLTDKGKEVKRIVTKGLNPYFRTKEDISQEIKTILVPELKNNQINAVYFFGAGCNAADKNEVVREAIADNLNCSHIEIDTDLSGAAIGLCGNKSGIVCILGTGSNSCYYNGKEIAENVSPLGYILGDEGSGAVLGKLFVGACLKNQLGNELKEQFLQEHNLTPTLILDKVYKQPMANRFLASLSPFILKHITDAAVYNLVYNAFKEFFVKNVMQYKDWQSTDVHFAGSVAYYYQDILCKVGAEMNIRIGIIEQSPMERLVKVLG